VPIFKQQVKSGGPLTVTHPEVTRYFLTIPEATQLVLQAGSMGLGGEIFILDMGQPVKILDLAEEVIRLSGLVPHEDIEIIFTGLRPGEKLYEELLLVGEGVKKTTHENICVAQAEKQYSPALLKKLEDLYAAARAMELKKLVTLLQEIVPEYIPQNKDYRRNTLSNDVPKKPIPFVKSDRKRSL